jgi:hypothetical protein
MVPALLMAVRRNTLSADPLIASSAPAATVKLLPTSRPPAQLRLGIVPVRVTSPLSTSNCPAPVFRLDAPKVKAPPSRFTAVLAARLNVPLLLNPLGNNSPPCWSSTTPVLIKARLP